MRTRFIDEETTTLDARLAAQRLAFAPLVFQAARALCDMGVLEHLNGCGRRGATPEEVAEALPDVSLYAARVLLEAGLVAGMVALDKDRFCITKTGYMVLRDALTRVNFDFVNDVCYRGAFHLEESLRTGRPAGLATLGPWPTIYAGLAELPPDVRRSWLAFDHFYSDGAFDQALPVLFGKPPELFEDRPELFEGRPKRILDVGGNTGKFAIRCCEYDPNVQVTIVDHPGQLAAASAAAAERGFGARVHTHAMDLLDADAPLPPGYDVYWMSQFLDCFSEPEITSIVARAARGMTEHSRLLVLETFWDRQKYEIGRVSVIATSLYFAALANGNSKMYHSERMRHCIEAAGLRVVDDRDGIGLSHTLLTCVRS
jgi:hypothetical protein